MGKIAYLVHDLNDPAVARRVRMLRSGHCEVVVIGFYRGLTPPDEISGAPAVPLSRTTDAKLFQRAWSVLKAVLFPGATRKVAAGADVVIGRNLEALALAVRIRGAPDKVRLIYECLDIHRLLLGNSVAARAIQALESWLLKGVDLLIVSSPAFSRHYRAACPSLQAPHLLLENRLLVLGDELPQPALPPTGPPWVIGWLGNLRCRRTFEVLTDLADRHAGRIQVIVAGRPTTAVFDDLPGAIENAPHCRFLGAYAPEDLGRIYAQCHFAWMIDWFEEGLNSAWLLPNRLYEAQAFGVVPIALASVEVGRWLSDHGAGVALDDALDDFDAKVAQISPHEYARLRNAVNDIPREHLLARSADCELVAAAIQGQ